MYYEQLKHSKNSNFEMKEAAKTCSILLVITIYRYTPFIDNAWKRNGTWRQSWWIALLILGEISGPWKMTGHRQHRNLLIGEFGWHEIFLHWFVEKDTKEHQLDDIRYFGSECPLNDIRYYSTAWIPHQEHCRLCENIQKKYVYWW